MTQHSNGILENLVFGLTDKNTKFKRVSMQSKDKFDVGTGYLYLQNEIQPSTASKVTIFIICLLISIFSWIIVLYNDDSSFYNNYIRRRK